VTEGVAPGERDTLGECVGEPEGVPCGEAELEEDAEAAEEELPDAEAEGAPLWLPLGEGDREAHEAVPDSEGEVDSTAEMVCVTEGGGSVSVTDAEKDGDTVPDADTLPVSLCEGSALLDTEAEVEAERVGAAVREAEEDADGLSSAEPLWLAEEDADGVCVAAGLTEAEAEAEADPDSVPGMSVAVGGGGKMVSVGRSLRDTEDDAVTEGDRVSTEEALLERVARAVAVEEADAEAEREAVEEVVAEAEGVEERLAEEEGVEEEDAEEEVVEEEEWLLVQDAGAERLSRALLEAVVDAEEDAVGEADAVGDAVREDVADADAEREGELVALGVLDSAPTSMAALSLMVQPAALSHAASQRTATKYQLAPAPNPCASFAAYVSLHVPPWRMW